VGLVSLLFYRTTSGFLECVPGKGRGVCGADVCAPLLATAMATESDRFWVPLTL